jgi:hypothetical protein
VRLREEESERVSLTNFYRLRLTRIGAEGVKEIAQALQGNNTLKEIE